MAPEPWHDQHVHPAESAIRTKTYLLPVNTQIAIRTELAAALSRIDEPPFDQDALGEQLDLSGGYTRWANVYDQPGNPLIDYADGSDQGPWKRAMDKELGLLGVLDHRIPEIVVGDVLPVQVAKLGQVAEGLEVPAARVAVGERPAAALQRAKGFAGEKPCCAHRASSCG